MISPCHNKDILAFSPREIMEDTNSPPPNALEQCSRELSGLEVMALALMMKEVRLRALKWISLGVGIKLIHWLKNHGIYFDTLLLFAYHFCWFLYFCGSLVGIEEERNTLLS